MSNNERKYTFKLCLLSSRLTDCFSSACNLFEDKKMLQITRCLFLLLKLIKLENLLATICVIQRDVDTAEFV